MTFLNTPNPSLRMHTDSLRRMLVGMDALDCIVEEAAGRISDAIRSGHKILVCGNGGSAADGSHFVAELMARFDRDREPWPAVCLSEGAATVTAIGNDFDFSQVFSRQVKALGKKGDVLFCLSTSGKSSNVLDGLRVARDCGLSSIGLYGKLGGEATVLTDLPICVPSESTMLIQEGHKIIIHTICGILEHTLAGQ